jgi:DNA-binding NarL/FixJ family response regulator
MMAQVRVLVVDDVSRVRRDLRDLLTLTDGIEVVGEASDGHEAIQQTQMLHPDVVLMDLEMPVLDGYSATRQIKADYPAARVIALSIHDYDAARQKAFQAGVDDFVEKGAPPAALLRAIKQRAKSE